jgi:O-antigen/teichoic acid export membrane protein
VFCVMLTLETQHFILATCARSTEDERYAVTALLAGVLTVGLTWWLVGPLGLLGVAAATMIAQMLTNNWYAVYRPMVRLQLSPREYFRRVVLLWAATLGGTLLVSRFVIGRVHDLGLGPVWVVGAAVAIAGVALAAALWWGVLEVSQRRGLLSVIRCRVALPGRQLQ